MSTSDKIRLDIAVQKQLPNYSRSTAAKLISDGLVKINGKIINKPSFKLNVNDKLFINDKFLKVKLPKIDIPIIYEDKDVVVINKPAGVLVHSKGSYNPEATVASWLQTKYSGRQSNRAGIVHRLDRLTSGVMIVGKNDQATKWLQKQFATRKVNKTYIAITKNHFSLPQAIIDLPIERHPQKPQSFRVGPNGKSAITEYKVLKTNQSFSLVELKPTTGRTHQLRVHLAYLKHPIVGDTLYGGLNADRLYLHAKSLEIVLPSNKLQQFEAPLPKAFKMYIDNAKSN